MKKAIWTILLIVFAVLGFFYVREKPTPSLSRSLAFPVSGSRANIGSFWGDERDGGKRRHEGIDIFAKKGTPVVAVCDGIITSVGTNRLGGKVIWMQACTHPWSAYYAHLDDQKVKAGQLVKKGQVLGTVGNTGNAITTPPHLHFGIYRWIGVADPLPYVRLSARL
jgi:murein DD-endopeptidase MepM/ murein hydrolase activator NlpD